MKKLPIRTMDDRELVERIRGGDGAAVAVLYDRYSRAAYGLATHILGDADSAGAVVQQAFLSVWRQAPVEVPERGPAGAWFMSIVHHQAIDALRRKRATNVDRHPVAEGMTRLPDANASGESAGRTGGEEQMLAALQQIPPDQQRAVLLAYFGGYTHDEIASLLALPAGIVPAYLRRGLRTLHHLSERQPGNRLCFAGAIAMCTSLRLRLILNYLTVLTASVGLPRLGHARRGALDLGARLPGSRAANLLAGYALRPAAEVRAQQQRFAVAASHELRTPLTILLGTLEAALLRRRTPEQYEEVLRRATAEAAHMTMLLGDILTLAHAESSTATLTTAPLDLRAVAQAAVEEMRIHAVGKEQVLTMALDDSLPARGDAHALHQAVTSLLDNAISYTPRGGRIHLAGQRMHGRAVLTIRDTGTGIAPRHLPHLGEPFYRVNPAPGHVGLGLARAAWIARAHSGRLAIESHVGAGTMVTLSLPLDRTPAPRTPAC